MMVVIIMLVKLLLEQVALLGLIKQLPMGM